MKTKDMVFVALFAAIMAVIGTIPAINLGFTPVPITLQTIGVMFAGAILGSRLGALSQLVFLSLVAVGAPLLANGKGGAAVFVGPTGGYLLGYIVGAFVIGFILERMKNVTFIKMFIANLIGGVLVLYLLGSPVLAFVTNISIVDAFKVNYAFIPGDLIKVTIATILSLKLRKALTIYIRPNQSESKVA
jgi:biotin transport system substrate-specific component